MGLVKALRKKFVIAGCWLTTLGLFAGQTIARDAHVRTGAILLPMIAAFAFSTAATASAPFHKLPFTGALIASAAVFLFVWGEIRADYGIRSLFTPAAPWWSEEVVGMSFLLGGLAIPTTFALTFLLCRFQDFETA